MNEEKEFKGHGKKNGLSGAPDRQQAKKSAYVYIAILFAVAFLLLLMAHFMQQRVDDPTAYRAPAVTQQVQEKGASSLLSSNIIIN